MLIILSGLLGFSISLNISLGLFLLFVFKNKKLTEQVYETFDKNVEVVKDIQDPFRRV